MRSACYPSLNLASYDQAQWQSLEDWIDRADRWVGSMFPRTVSDTFPAKDRCEEIKRERLEQGERVSFPFKPQPRIEAYSVEEARKELPADKVRKLVAPFVVPMKWRGNGSDWSRFLTLEQTLKVMREAKRRGIELAECRELMFPTKEKKVAPTPAPMPSAKPAKPAKPTISADYTGFSAASVLSDLDALISKLDAMMARATPLTTTPDSPNLL